MPQGGGAPPQGGDPMSIIMNLRSMVTPEAVSLEQLNTDADQVANILAHTPAGIPRRQIYNTVKAKNQQLYDIANSRLEALENQAKQQGVEAMRQGQM